jgi:glucokinase
MRVLAFDVGGTRLKAAVVQDGRAAEPVSRSTAGIDAAAVVPLLVAVANDLAPGGDVDAVGVAVPGIVDDGRVLSLPGKFDGLVGHDVAGALTAALRLPVTVVNDAVAAGVGEATSGAGIGHRRVVTMTIGTGVGTAVTEDGKALGSGAWGGGLLGGQIPIASPDTGPADSNGKRGTIEACCAAGRLVDAARDAGCDVADARALLQLWSTGDDAARRAVSTYRSSLEQALVALAQAHAPSMIVVGGGPVSTSAGWLLDGMSELVHRRLWAGHHCAVVPAALGDAAALVGVAALAAAARH